ncbi:MAG: ganB [Polyangiaceae bacterium]|jgi:hypothetical protein|nr:ganB [Polyangiaceae bacterium]
MRAARRNRTFGTAQLALLLAAGCSLQDFDYLQKGTGGSNAGGTESSSAGTSAAGTESREGGAGAEPSSGGTSGNEPSGGTKSGGTNAGGTSAGGTSAGSGGKGGGGGAGATGELVNGSFETNSVAGWTVDPPSALQNPPRYAFVQPPQGTGTVPDGNYQFSTWHMEDPFDVDMSQTIKGLKDGTYVFKGYFNLDTGLIVEVYAKDCGGAEPDPVSVLSAGASAWSPVLVEGIEVKGGSCTVGLRIESTPPHWLNADLFTFEPDPNANPGGDGGASGAGGADTQ